MKSIKLGEIKELVPDMSFSYSQFSVYDKECIDVPNWTENHIRQGFIRSKYVVSFTTMMEYGVATVVVNLIDSIEDISFDEFHRVISVPIEIKTGIVAVDGPEEYPIERCFMIDPGKYNLIAAQRIESSKANTEIIYLFFEESSSTADRSKIFIADDAITATEELIETADNLN